MQRFKNQNATPVSTPKGSAVKESQNSHRSTLTNGNSNSVLQQAANNSAQTSKMNSLNTLAQLKTQNNLPAQLYAGPVVQFGCGSSKMVMDDGGIARYRQEGEKTYPWAPYESEQYLQEVNLAHLVTSEEGDKSNKALNDDICDKGFNTFYAVLVFVQEDGSLKLVDGHHRVTEMKNLEEATIPAYVIPYEVHMEQEQKKAWHSIW